MNQSKGSGGGGAHIPVPDDDDMPDSGRKRSGGEEVGSPVSYAKGGSKQDDPSRPLTLGALQRLLQSQTQLLQASQDSAIQAAVTELKMNTSRELSKVKDQLAKHDDHIAQLRDLQDSTDKRLAALEQRRDSVGSGSTEPPPGGKINLMIFGGWPDDTPRETLLTELKEALVIHGIQDEFTDVFCTGPRKGFAMGLVWTDQTENPKDLKKRMISIAQTIRKANVKCDSMSQGKTLWASLGRTPTERAMASHVGRTKRIILETNPDLKPHVEADYNAGLVWVMGHLVSATSRAPAANEETTPGKIKGSWIHLHQIATYTGGKLEQLRQRWDELTAY